MDGVWNPEIYDLSRHRIVPRLDAFYDTAADLVATFCQGLAAPRILELGTGTGIFSERVAKRIPGIRLEVLDISSGMLAKALTRLTEWKPETHIQDFRDPLPSGPFDAVISAVAIHHLDDAAKRDLYRRIRPILTPGGIFLNADEIAGRTPLWRQFVIQQHHDFCRDAGCTPEEISELLKREAYDLCSPVETQLRWLEEFGFVNAEAPYRYFRFAILAAFRPKDPPA